jgi:hypothetical protein
LGFYFVGFFFVYFKEIKIKPVLQLDFEIFRMIASFIKISSGHSLIIKLTSIKVLQDNIEK